MACSAFRNSLLLRRDEDLRPEYYCFAIAPTIWFSKRQNFAIAPTIWFSKRQNSVEASTSGSEFTAMKNVVEMIEALHYKLRMLGVPIEGPTMAAPKRDTLLDSFTY
jgi:hypothetical protein